MEKNREIKIIAVVALLVAVVGLSVAYAALSTTLEISGTATINSASWDVKFIGGTHSKVGGASFVEPTVSSTSITGYSAKLTMPGDSVTYNFKIANQGSINATLGTVNIGSISCSGTDSAEANATCGNLTYSVTYADGTAIKTGDALNAGASRDAKITITFNSSATTVPRNAVTVNGMDVTLIYNQA